MGRSSAVLVAWVGLLVIGIGVGHAVGAEMLSVPGAEVAAWQAWAVTTDPLVVTMALLRAGALGVAWYLLVTTLLSVVARGFQLVRLVHLADAVAAPAVRRLVHRSMGVVVASAIATSVTAPTAYADDPPPVPVVEEGSGVLTMRGVLPRPGGAEPTDGATVTLPWERLQGSGARVVDSSDDAADTEHTVRPGDSLWRIAEARLEQAWGREPLGSEVVPYWREVIERNRDRLVVADDPDLILPGQELLLPTVARP